MDVRVHELQLTRARAEQLMDRQRKANAVANMQRRRAPELAYLEERLRQTIDCMQSHASAWSSAVSRSSVPCCCSCAVL